MAATSWQRQRATLASSPAAVAVLAEWRVKLALGVGMNASSNVEWCEALVMRNSGGFGSNLVREPMNTVSNAAFFLFATLGLARLANQTQLPRAMLATEATLLLVGLGSVLFHATASYLGELLDEFPMSIMAIGYLECLRGIHPLTRSPRFYQASHGAVLVSWGAYFYTHAFMIFQVCFTVQVIVAALISVSAGHFEAEAGPLIVLRTVPRRNFWLFILMIGLGKGAWEWERVLYHSDACPTEMSDLRYWLHPFWHFGSAAAHSSWMAFVAQLKNTAAMAGEASQTGQKRE